MNLLPRAASEFGESSYWDVFFKQRGNKSFEWYGEYPELCGFIHKYIKPAEKFLVAGCGNSKLSSNLYDVGYRNMVNVDISKIVIKQMNAQNAKDRPDLKFLEMDLLEMTFEPETFSAVLDKGTLDALMPEDNAQSVETAEKYFSEIGKILKIGGRYLVVSLLQAHILAALLDHFVSAGWMVRIYRCHEAEQKALDDGATNALPVFVVVVTKFKKMPNRAPIIEMCLTHDGHMTRYEDPGEVRSLVREAQEVALVCIGLRSTTLANNCQEIRMDVLDPTDQSVKYRVVVIEKPNMTVNAMKYAAFVVPQGRESEWLFGTPEGRQCLLDSTNVGRLAVIILERNHKCETLLEVQNDLNHLVKEMAPNNYKGRIEFLSLGGDIGSRKEIARGRSNMSGEYLVEDCTNEKNEIFRRLYFLSSQNVIQSEAKMKYGDTKKGGDNRLSVDRFHLSCAHHSLMAAGVSLLTESNDDSGSQRLLVVGLGGGGLCSFLTAVFKKTTITAVELDPDMLKVAKEHFGLTVGKSLNVVISDGLDFIRESAKKGEQYSAIMFDVDSKDMTVGMSCPPSSFVQADFLKCVANVVTDNGIFMLNLVCRDPSLRDEVWKRLKFIFGSVGSFKLDDYLNEIVYCWKKEGLQPKPLLLKAVQTMLSQLRRMKIERPLCLENPKLANLIMTS
ncbi:hypothetical protein AAG570_001557 [Ranatra chinensis]|uniref:Methyltransferase domain-containing protein n=1 Tax=Ranatra chinensis TaxID=642074 RepID=A0ABD0YAU3_9HEMI